MKKLPIGITTFSEIIEKNYLYIDKTQIAYDLIKNYKYVFLSRPRRFGKSLFIDTLKEIFEANQALFKQLAIYPHWNWERSFPVIKISFGGNRNTAELKRGIFDVFKDNQKRLGIECDDMDDYALCFKQIIQKSYEKYQTPVVILIDEYDKPILDNLDQMDVAIECREIIKRLYTQIKENDRYIRFAFLTGVSKFSKASVFSGLNMLEDISLTPEFGNICGYTQYDIDNQLADYLQGTDLKKVKQWYNGYNFLKDDIYNPFDILLFIRNKFVFKNYWFSTGTPMFLIKLFKKNHYNLAKFENIEIGEELLDSFDIENISLETVMFQTGYLTIKEIQQFGDNLIYTLTFPNVEVKKSFNDYLLNHYFIQSSQKAQVQIALYKQLYSAKLDTLEVTLTTLFASIAYNNFSKNDIQNYEGFYASVVYAYFAGAGFEKIIAEDANSNGRIDLSVFVANKVYIFEFKVDGANALQQIKDKNYHQAYIKKNRDIYLVGVEFDKISRNISKFEWEKVPYHIKPSNCTASSRKGS